jgi:lactoylglutathione lyase
VSHGSTVIAFIEDPDGYPIEFIQKGTAEWARGGDADESSPGEQIKGV